MIMKSKYVDFQRLNDQMDTAIRDAEIRAFWKGLSYSDLNSSDKISIIKEHYFLSNESVTRIIYNK